MSTSARTIPFDASPRQALADALLVGGCTALVLLLYQPFGTYEDPLPNKSMLLAGYGLVGGVTWWVLQAGAGALHRRLVADGQWRWPQLVVLLVAGVLALGVGWYLYYVWWFGESLSLQALFDFYRFTLAIAVLPVALIVWRLRLVTRLAAQPAPAAVPPAAPPPTMLNLRGDNRDEQLILAPADLLWLQAADNYTEVVHRGADGRLQRRLLRGSLSGFETQLEALVIRIHRAYLVNPANVQRVRGNAHGLQLQVAGDEDWLPVARNHVAAVRVRLGDSSR